MTKSKTTTTYDYVILDSTKVPFGYWSPDERKIRAAIDKGVREIPGVDIIEKKVVR